MDTLSSTKEARMHNGKKTTTLTSGAGKTGQPPVKEIRTLSNTIHKNKLKMDKDLNVRPETVKFFEENIGRTLSDKNHSKILYDPPPSVMEMKVKINKWGLITLKSFCPMKETISKVKRQPSEWEKIIANEATDK